MIMHTTHDSMKYTPTVHIKAVGLKAYLGMYMSTTLYFRVAGRRAAVLQTFLFPNQQWLLRLRCGCWGKGVWCVNQGLNALLGIKTVPRSHTCLYIRISRYAILLAQLLHLGYFDVVFFAMAECWNLNPRFQDWSWCSGVLFHGKNAPKL